MKVRKFNKLEQFINILVQHDQDHPEDIYPPPIDSNFAIDCLTEAFLGPDYYIVLPCCNDQANTIIVDEILRTYSKDYRRLVKEKQKELRT